MTLQYQTATPAAIFPQAQKHVYVLNSNLIMINANIFIT